MCEKKLHPENKYLDTNKTICLLLLVNSINNYSECAVYNSHTKKNLRTFILAPVLFTNESLKHENRTPKIRDHIR